MRRIVVNNSVTLDGVMQAPGRPDEDRRGGFEHGGWAAPYFDSVMAEAAGEGIATGRHAAAPPRGAATAGSVGAPSLPVCSSSPTSRARLCKSRRSSKAKRPFI